MARRIASFALVALAWLAACGASGGASDASQEEPRACNEEVACPPRTRCIVSPCAVAPCLSGFCYDERGRAVP